MHPSVIDHLFNPEKNAEPLAMACDDDFDAACLLMQLRKPPLSLLKALTQRLEGLVATESVPAVLSVSDARRIGLNGSLCHVFGSKENDPLTVSLKSTRFVVTALMVAKNYVEYPLNAITELMSYEMSHTPSVDGVLGLLGDRARIGRYAAPERADLEHAQQELTDICSAVAWWWIKNPKALFAAPLDLVLNYVALVKVVRRPSTSILRVMGEIARHGQKDVANMITVLITGIVIARRELKLVVESLGVADTIVLLLRSVMLSTEPNALTRGAVNIAIMLLTQDATQCTGVDSDSYIVEQAAMHMLSHKDIEPVDVQLVLALLATHSVNNPKRRVLNLTHDSITRALTAVNETEFNDLRRLITASATNRRDFDTYDAVLSAEDRLVWWGALHACYIDCGREEEGVREDAITMHPIINDGGILVAPDSMVRAETILRRTSNGKFCNPFTNVEETWNEVIKSKSMQLHLETYYSNPSDLL